MAHHNLAPHQASLLDQFRNSAGSYSTWAAMAWKIGSEWNCALRLPIATVASQDSRLAQSLIGRVHETLERLHRVQKSDFQYSTHLFSLEGELVLYTTIGTPSEGSQRHSDATRFIDRAAVTVVNGAQAFPDWYRGSYAFDLEGLIRKD